MDTIVQWASILSPIIAVLLAWWTSRSSAKDTDKKLAAMRDIAISQIDASLLEMEYEFFKAETNMKDCKDEILSLRKELEQMKNRPFASESDRQVFLNKIGKLNSDSNWQMAWWKKLFIAQSNLVFAKQRLIKKYNN